MSENRSEVNKSSLTGHYEFRGEALEDPQAIEYYFWQWTNSLKTYLTELKAKNPSQYEESVRYYLTAVLTTRSCDLDQVLGLPDFIRKTKSSRNPLYEEIVTNAFFSEELAELIPREWLEEQISHHLDSVAENVQLKSITDFLTLFRAVAFPTRIEKNHRWLMICKPYQLNLLSWSLTNFAMQNYETVMKEASREERLAIFVMGYLYGFYDDSIAGRKRRMTLARYFFPDTYGGPIYQLIKNLHLRYQEDLFRETELPELALIRGVPNKITQLVADSKKLHQMPSVSTEQAGVDFDMRYSPDDFENTANYNLARATYVAEAQRERQDLELRTHRSKVAVEKDLDTAEHYVGRAINHHQEYYAGFVKLKAAFKDPLFLSSFFAHLKKILSADDFFLEEDGVATDIPDYLLIARSMYRWLLGHNINIDFHPYSEFIKAENHARLESSFLDVNRLEIILLIVYEAGYAAQKHPNSQHSAELMRVYSQFIKIFKYDIDKLHFKFQQSPDVWLGGSSLAWDSADMDLAVARDELAGLDYQTHGLASTESLQLQAELELRLQAVSKFADRVKERTAHNILHDSLKETWSQKYENKIRYVAPLVLSMAIYPATLVLSGHLHEPSQQLWLGEVAISLIAIEATMAYFLKDVILNRTTKKIVKFLKEGQLDENLNQNELLNDNLALSNEHFFKAVDQLQQTVDEVYQQTTAEERKHLRSTYIFLMLVGLLIGIFGTEAYSSIKMGELDDLVGSFTPNGENRGNYDFEASYMSSPMNEAQTQHQIDDTQLFYSGNRSLVFAGGTLCYPIEDGGGKVACLNNGLGNFTTSTSEESGNDVLVPEFQIYRVDNNDHASSEIDAAVDAGFVVQAKAHRPGVSSLSYELIDGTRPIGLIVVGGEGEVNAQWNPLTGMIVRGNFDQAFLVSETIGEADDLSEPPVPISPGYFELVSDDEFSSYPRLEELRLGLITEVTTELQNQQESIQGLSPEELARQMSLPYEQRGWRTNGEILDLINQRFQEMGYEYGNTPFDGSEADSYAELMDMILNESYWDCEMFGTMSEFVMRLAQREQYYGATVYARVGYAIPNDIDLTTNPHDGAMVGSGGHLVQVYQDIDGWHSYTYTLPGDSTYTEDQSEDDEEQDVFDQIENWRGIENQGWTDLATRYGLILSVTLMISALGSGVSRLRRKNRISDGPLPRRLPSGQQTEVNADAGPTDESTVEEEMAEAPEIARAREIENLVQRLTMMQVDVLEITREIIWLAIDYLNPNWSDQLANIKRISQSDESLFDTLSRQTIRLLSRPRSADSIQQRHSIRTQIKAALLADSSLVAVDLPIQTKIWRSIGELDYLQLKELPEETIEQLAFTLSQVRFRLEDYLDELSSRDNYNQETWDKIDQAAQLLYLITNTLEG